MMMQKVVLAFVLSLCVVSGKLLLDRDFQGRNNDDNNIGGDWPINDTVTFISNISSFIPADCPLPANQWIVRSGYALAEANGTSSFGFIFYGAQAAKGNLSDLPNHPVMVWLQGGPGSSSQFGNFEEMGPLLVRGKGPNPSNYTFSCNPYTWNLNYSMIFIDNPISTGLSYAQNVSSLPTNQDQVADQLYYGLVQLFTKGVLQNFTQSDFFIFGESYAGKYVPSIAQKILQMNKNVSRQITIPLKGIGIGDGFTDPKIITDTFGVFAFNLGLIDLQERAQVQGMTYQGDYRMQTGEWEKAKGSFNDILNYITQQSGMNDVYNFQNQETPNPLDLSQFLNSSWAKTAFGLPQQLKYTDSSFAANQALGSDFMQSDVVQRLESVLQTGFPVLYYNGQNDVIVCTPCTEIWLDKINYQGNQNGNGTFYNAAFTTWNATVKGVNQIVGYYKGSANLDFYTVNKAGHMVPSDQPEASLTLVTNWINKLLSNSSSQNIYSIEQ